MISSPCARYGTLTLVTAVFAAGAAMPGGAADWKPDKPIEFVVPAPAGGALDTPARTVQRIWQELKLVELPVNVVNRSGGGQSVAGMYVAQAAKDPHRLVLMSTPLLVNHITGNSKLHYTDFTLIGQLFTEYLVLSVRSDAAIRTAGDLVARLKAAPDSMSVAIGAARGNNSHVAIAIPLKHAGVDIRRLKTVVFPSAGQSITNLLGGHVDFATGALSVAAPHWKGGKVRILAITAPKRLEAEYSEIPTWREQGVDVVVSNRRFMLAPPGLTPAQIAYWDGIFLKTVASPEWRKVLAQEQWVDEYISSASARKLLDQEYLRIREVLVDLGMAK